MSMGTIYIWLEKRKAGGQSRCKKQWPWFFPNYISAMVIKLWKTMDKEEILKVAMKNRRARSRETKIKMSRFSLDTLQIRRQWRQFFYFWRSYFNYSVSPFPSFYTLPYTPPCSPSHSWPLFPVIFPACMCSVCVLRLKKPEEGCQILQNWDARLL